ncbi:MAG TPA: 50S ribosomal protein L2 [Planctomycetota bacterium]|nr:50S ribosomal protein L2 [Planctomycetota bacterium]HRR81408.1 50S ribosomal protein L2 [Planctomycetota bacterium]HRT94753.1 50S ribosomal protein L2 [Planctomycetota bacterium]
MAIRQRKPTTPSQRHTALDDFADVTRHRPEPSLLEPIKKSGGRNNYGRVTARRQGGGNKRRFRTIDFRRDKDGVPAKVAAIEYDPNRTARIALLHYADGEKRYILAPRGLGVGQKVESGEKVEPNTGNCMPLANIPSGLPIHNIEVRPGRGAKLVRSAGLGATISAKEGDYAHIILPSGEVRKVHIRCRATIGQVSNLEHSSISLGKAGRHRWLGFRPCPRGVAQNPVSHPMGGGEGRSSGGRHPCSPWGKLSKGGKTRKRRNPTSSMIIRRRQKKSRR